MINELEGSCLTSETGVGQKRILTQGLLTSFIWSFQWRCEKSSLHFFCLNKKSLDTPSQTLNEKVCPNV